MSDETTFFETLKRYITGGDGLETIKTYLSNNKKNLKNSYIYYYLYKNFDKYNDQVVEVSKYIDIDISEKSPLVVYPNDGLTIFYYILFIGKIKKNEEKCKILLEKLNDNFEGYCTKPKKTLFNISTVMKYNVEEENSVTTLLFEISSIFLNDEIDKLIDLVCYSNLQELEVKLLFNDDKITELSNMINIFNDNIFIFLASVNINKTQENREELLRILYSQKNFSDIVLQINFNGENLLCYLIKFENYILEDFLSSITIRKCFSFDISTNTYNILMEKNPNYKENLDSLEKFFNDFYSENPIYYYFSKNIKFDQKYIDSIYNPNLYSKALYILIKRYFELLIPQQIKNSIEISLIDYILSNEEINILLKTIFEYIKYFFINTKIDDYIIYLYCIVISLIDNENSKFFKEEYYKFPFDSNKYEVNRFLGIPENLEKIFIKTNNLVFMSGINNIVKQITNYRYINYIITEHDYDYDTDTDLEQFLFDLSNDEYMENIENMKKILLKHPSVDLSDTSNFSNSRLLNNKQLLITNGTVSTSDTGFSTNPVLTSDSVSNTNPFLLLKTGSPVETVPTVPQEDTVPTVPQIETVPTVPQGETVPQVKTVSTVVPVPQVKPVPQVEPETVTQVGIVPQIETVSQVETVSNPETNVDLLSKEPVVQITYNILNNNEEKTEEDKVVEIYNKSIIEKKEDERVVEFYNKLIIEEKEKEEKVIELYNKSINEEEKVIELYNKSINEEKAEEERIVELYNKSINEEKAKEERIVEFYNESINEEKAEEERVVEFYTEYVKKRETEDEMKINNVLLFYRNYIKNL